MTETGNRAETSRVRSGGVVGSFLAVIVGLAWLPASAQDHQPIDGRVDSSRVREGSLREPGIDPRASYRTLDSLVMANRMGAARSFADSILPSIPSTSLYHDSVRAKRAYLEDLLTRRTKPPPPPPRPWSLTTGIVTGWESFQWKRGRSEWAQTMAGSYEVVSGMVSNPFASSAPIEASTGMVAGLDATGSVSFGIGLVRNRLEASGRLGFSREDSVWTKGFSQLKPGFVSAVGGWEVTGEPLWQWLGGDLVSEGIFASLAWNTRGTDRPWSVSMEGGATRLPRQELIYRQAAIEVSHRRVVHGWMGQIATEVGWTDRQGVSSNFKPVRVASCDGIQDGEPASTANLSCYSDPTSDSIVPFHLFKGLSGAPYLPGVDLAQSSWSSSVRMGTSLVVFREFSRRRFSLQSVAAYVFERSLDAVRWNNGYFGNPLGDSLYVYHDRATGQDFLWEKDLRSRFLRLERRAEPLSLQSLVGQIRGGFRPIAPLELHLECMVGRTWSSLPDESLERGNFRWQALIGAAWEW